MLTAAALALMAFLGLTGLALDRAFRDSQLSALQDRLQGYLYAFLANTEVTRTGSLLLPEPLPEPRLERPGSGLYAGISGPVHRWESPSAMGRALPFDLELAPGDKRFLGPLTTVVGGVYLLSEGVAFEAGGPDGEDIFITLHIAEHERGLNRQVAVFREMLWTYLGGAAILLLALLLVVLRWSLKPLRLVARELGAIEQGRRERLSERYPDELVPLTANLNTFIEAERENLARYRHTLSDLAHSLKTPLAVVRSQMESGEPPDVFRSHVGEQIDRMDAIVAYQLSRAATSGHRTLAAPLSIETRAEALVTSLEKVYASKNLLCEFDIDPAARFFGEEGDLMELLGNLLENAFKWARHRVLLTVKPLQPPGTRRPGLLLAVEDDGPGIAEDQVENVLQRGVRGDERVHGHGIGLAIVQDILKAYRGRLEVARSELGGARFVIDLPPLV
ncbi:MAG TPA: ATP-binding protein [Xanthomonadaceae bacterium]|nr:ATP-binding protein [Xanthomonadaceae bacterium]